MKVTKQTFATFTRKKVPLANTIHHSSFIYNQFKKLNLCKFYSNRVINHLMSILISIFISGYHGKTTDFAKNSSCHRTTIAHFLNSGKWNDSLLSDTLKQSVIEIIYSEAARTGNPVFCIVDDTIASKTKPLSRALHPIEDAYFHQSHLKKKQDYGHQAVAVMLSCNGIVLNYAFVMYNKSISKIDIVQNIAKELAAELSVTHNGFDLATVKKRKYYVYRWSIEIFFRQCKDKMALDGYQLRSAQGIKRYWLLMSLAHFMCIAGTGEFCSFETGYHKICSIVQLEKYRYLFQCAKESDDFDSFIKLAG